MQRHSHAVNLTQGTLWKQMILFAIPLLLSNIFQLMYNTADTVIVGNAIGTNALAAVGAGGQLVTMVVGFSLGFSTGSSVVIARHFGAGEKDKIEKTVHTALCSAFVGGIVLTLFCELVAPFILRLINTPESVFDLAVLYLRLYFLGLTSLLLYNVGAGILRGVGNSFYPLVFLVITSLVNIGLDLLFVVVFHWGVAGAAVATVLSQTLSCIMVLSTLLRTKEMYRFSFKKMGIDLPTLKDIVNIGVPTGLQSVVAGASRVVIQSKVNLFGELAMAGTVSYTKVDGFQMMPIEAVCTTTTTLISQNLGANNESRARQGAKYGVLFCFFFALLSGALIYAFIPQILSIFTQDPTAISYGSRMCSVMATTYFLIATSSCLGAVIRGTGDARNPMLISTAYLCVFRMIWCSFILLLWNDIMAIYISYPISWVLNVGTMWLYYKLRCPLGRKKPAAVPAGK